MSQNDDLISRQDVIDALHTWFRDGFDEDKWWNSTHVLAAIEGIPSAQQGYKWETCFECPLSHGCPKIKGCTNEQAIEYASQIPNDCPLSTQSDHNAGIDKKVEGDCISRQIAIDAMKDALDPHIVQFVKAKMAIEALPSVQPEPSEITDEQAILHLQSTGWMQNHDREIYESGLKEQLADDSESYDSLIPYENAISRQAAIDLFPDDDLEYDTKGGYIAPHLARQMICELPSAQPEIIRCKDCKHRDPEDKKCDCGHDIRWQLPRHDDWHCADAERRTDAAD